MITDILLIITVVAGPILVFIMAVTQRWQWSLIPMAIFSVFWILWFFLPTTVPFGILGKIWWFIIALGSLAIAEIVGLFLRKRNLRKCDPRVQECKF